MSSESRGQLFVVSAPSGTGKTTLVERLVQTVPNLMLSRSFTSRAPRAGEQDGVDYNFISRERFETMKDAGEFLECLEQKKEPLVVIAPHGLYPCRAIDMNDGRNLVFPFRHDTFGEQHERGLFLPFENFGRSLGKHDRGERTERLSVLHPGVEEVLHLGIPRIS